MYSCQDEHDFSSSNQNRSSGINLNEVFPKASFLNTNHLVVRSCSGSWQECRDDDLFVALVDANHDGHEDASRAIARGANAILGERMLPVSSPQCIVPDSRIAYGKLCHALSGSPSRHLTTIGVAGTDGKTTTAHLIQSIFEEAGLTSGLSTSISPFGDSSTMPAHSTTEYPHHLPPQIAKWLSDSVIQGNHYALLEASSVSLAQHQMAGMELDVAVLTNIRGSHFDFHGSLANYRRAQLRLLDYLSPTGIAVINADDPRSFFALNQIEVPTITVGIRQAAEVEATPLTSDLNDQTFLLTAGRQSVTVRTRMVGRHHIDNCLVAAAVALTCEIDLTTIARGIERVSHLPGRLSAVVCGQPFHVIIDEAASPHRLAVALKSLRNACRGKLICVFSASDDTTKICGQFGRVAERSCHLPVITNSRANHPSALESAHRVLDGFDKPHKAQVIPNRIKAIEWALSQAGEGDVVLVAGNGQRSITKIGENRWELTDRDVCESWLYNQVSLTPPPKFSNPAVFRIDDYR